MQHHGQRDAVEEHLVDKNPVQFVLDRLPARTDVHQVGRGKWIRLRQGFALGRHKPGLLDLDTLSLDGDFSLARPLGVAGLFDEGEVIESHYVLGVLLGRLFELDLGLFRAAHFVKDFAVLHQRRGVDLLLLNFGDERQGLLVGPPAFQRVQRLVVFLLEFQGGLVFGIDGQDTFDVNIGFLESRALLGLFGEGQADGGEAGNRFLGLLINAHADALHQFVGLFVKPGGGDQVDLVLRLLRLGQGLSQHDDGGLPADGFICGGVSGVGLSHEGSGRRHQKKTEKVGCFHHDGSRVETKSMRLGFRSPLTGPECTAPWCVW